MIVHFLIIARVDSEDESRHLVRVCTSGEQETEYRDRVPSSVTEALGLKGDYFVAKVLGDGAAPAAAALLDSREISPVEIAAFVTECGEADLHDRGVKDDEDLSPADNSMHLYDG